MKLPNAYKLLKRNWKTIVAFQAIYKLGTAFIVTPALYGLLNASIRLSGLTYVSNDTIRAYLLSPFTFLFLFAILLLVTFVSLVDTQAMICCCHASFYHERMQVSQMFYAGFTKARRVFRRQNWLAVVFVLLIIPLTNVAAVSGYISSLEVPEFIRDFINANTALYVLYRLIGTALVLIAFRWALSLHTFTLENVTFTEAGRRSAALMKGRYIRTILYTLLWEFLLLLAGLLLGGVLTGVAFAGIRLFCPARMQYTAAITVLLPVFIVVTALMTFLSVPFIFAYLSAAYYKYKTKTGQPIPPPETYKTLALNKRARKVLVTVLCLAVVGNIGMLIAQEYTGYQYMRNILNRPEIAAHRGSCAEAPENSVPAFERAIQEGADWIELDVHQTADGVVVVAHDESLKRIAGVDEKIWALTYEEIARYDVGSWFSPAFSGLRMATLDEVLKLCKGKIKLNIELKPTGHEPDFEQNVIELLRQNDYLEGEYILASLNAGALRNIKAIDENIETLFIMTVAAGQVLDIDFADAFSIEETSVDQRLTDKIHAAGKQIYVWTVNREDNALKVMRMRVDCILTDDPLMVRRVMNEGDLQDEVKWIAGLFFTPEETAVRPDTVQGP